MAKAKRLVFHYLLCYARMETKRRIWEIFRLAEAYVHSDANKKNAEEYDRCIPFAI